MAEDVDYEEEGEGGEEEEGAEEEGELEVKTTGSKYGHRPSAVGVVRRSPAPDFTGDEEEEDLEVTHQEINSIIEEISVDEDKIDKKVADIVDVTNTDAEELLTTGNLKQGTGRGKKRTSEVTNTESNEEISDNTHRRRSKRKLRYDQGLSFVAINVSCML